MRIHVFKRAISVLALALLTVVGAEAATDYIRVTLVGVQQGNGNRRYGGDDQAGYYCVEGGDNCMVVVTIQTPDGTCDEVMGPPPGIVVHVPFGSVTGHNTQTSQTCTMPVSGFTFLPNEYRLRIDQCPAYPGMVGRQIDLGGKTLDGSGVLHVFVPFTP